jgi:hypothetical protein
MAIALDCGSRSKHGPKAAAPFFTTPTTMYREMGMRSWLNPAEAEFGARS